MSRIGPAPYYKKGKTVQPESEDDTQAHLRYVFLQAAHHVDPTLYPDLAEIVPVFGRELAEACGILTVGTQLPKTEQGVEAWVNKFYDTSPWLYDHAWTLLKLWLANPQLAEDGLTFEPLYFGHNVGPIIPAFEPPEPKLQSDLQSLDETLDDYAERVRQSLDEYVNKHRKIIANQGFKKTPVKRSHVRHALWLAIKQLLGYGGGLIAAAESVDRKGVNIATQGYANLIGLKQRKLTGGKKNEDYRNKAIAEIGKLIKTINTLV